MFGRKKEIEDLKWEVEYLKSKVKTLKEEQKEAVNALRQQMVKIAQGKTVSKEAILEGIPFDLIGAKSLPTYLEKNPKAIVLDVRSQGEWDLGHISGAIHIPVEILESRYSQLKDKNQDILVICASGNRSLAASELLIKKGYTEVKNVEGGMSAYPGKSVTPYIFATISA